MAATDPSHASPVVRYEVAERIATVTLNRPEVRNALSSEVLDLLFRLLRRAESGEALSAYDQGKARGVRRLPAGSYSTRIV